MESNYFVIDQLWKTTFPIERNRANTSYVGSTSKLEDVMHKMITVYFISNLTIACRVYATNKIILS